MRMLGLTSIILAAGLAFAGPAAAQEPAPAPAATAAAAEATENSAASAADAAAAPAADTAAAPEVADPTLDADGLPLTAPVAGVGQPVDGTYHIQDQVTPTGVRGLWFHNKVLLPLITAVSLFVLVLLVWVVVRYRRAANPVPSKTSHHVGIEVAWTLIPVLILIGIAIPSIKLLQDLTRPAPKNAVTLKAIGNQWFWTYEYPDHGGVQLTSNMLREKGEVPEGQRYRTDADGPRLLATDTRVVLPVGVPIRLLTTAADVIHSWAIPAFWVKLDAVPGRINETGFIIEKPGVYFGQCSELCGARHGFMPITVEAVSPEVFEQWVKSKGGTIPLEVAAAAAAQASAEPTTNETEPANASNAAAGNTGN